MRHDAELVHSALKAEQEILARKAAAARAGLAAVPAWKPPKVQESFRELRWERTHPKEHLGVQLTRKIFGLDHRVVITKVSSIASRLGLRAGHHLIAVNGTPVKTQDAAAALLAAGGNSVVLQIAIPPPKVRNTSSLAMLTWALDWMYSNYPYEYRNCLFLIVTVVVAISLQPILLSNLFEVAVPGYLGDSGPANSGCLVDVSGSVGPTLAAEVDTLRRV